MSDTEKRLKFAVNNLFHVVRMNGFMKRACGELNEMLDVSDYELKMFEDEPGMRKFIEAKNYFDNLMNMVKNSFGSDAISSAYNAFKETLDNEAFMESLNLSQQLSASEKSNIFRKVFDKLLVDAEEWDSELDIYSYFIENTKEMLMPTEELNTEADEICPYCSGVPAKILKSEFFGPHSSEGEGYIWGCECGAYAVMNRDGRVAGKLGDTILHQKRNLVKGAICELCGLAGMTCFESCRWFSYITGMRIQNIADTEYLDANACNLALRVFILEKKTIQEAKDEYPKDRNGLFTFFADGGRLVVCNAYGFQHGKLIIPAEIGTDGIKIFDRGGTQAISFPPGLNYEFNDEYMLISHPSGKKEKFKMLLPHIRSRLFNLQDINIEQAAQAG
jgi:hypothetical protein